MSVTIEQEIEVEVNCECGAALGASVGRDGTTIEVELCNHCVEIERKEAYEDGFNEGIQEGGQ